MEIYRNIPESELNKMRNNINQMRLENGEPELTEEEERYFYGDHVVRRILEDYKKGVILEKGMAAWY